MRPALLFVDLGWHNARLIRIGDGRADALSRTSRASPQLAGAFDIRLGLRVVTKGLKQSDER